MSLRVLGGSSLQATRFDRDELANWYAVELLKADPGVRAISSLWDHAPDREICFLEVSDLMVDRNDDVLKPLDFGVNVGSAVEHKIFVLDITPSE